MGHCDADGGAGLTVADSKVWSVPVFQNLKMAPEILVIGLEKAGAGGLLYALSLSLSLSLSAIA
ncbi:MAG: hypothetical protein P0119_14035 [Nitrospira sp.]|nr:hypothetical protein [Nitrospira sp.]